MGGAARSLDLLIKPEEPTSEAMLQLGIRRVLLFWAHTLTYGTRARGGGERSVQGTAFNFASCNIGSTRSWIQKAERMFSHKGPLDEEEKLQSLPNPDSGALSQNPLPACLPGRGGVYAIPSNSVPSVATDRDCNTLGIWS